MEDKFGGLSLRKKAAPQSGCAAADTSVSLVKWQQGEQAVWRQWVFSFSMPYNITDAKLICSNDVLDQDQIFGLFLSLGPVLTVTVKLQ